jgi:hypothetical protein
VLVQDAALPAVWLQLWKDCCANPAGQKEAVRSIALQLAADRQQLLATRQQDLAGQQQQSATQQEELAADGQGLSQQQLGQIGELHQQLAAQAQRVGLLQGRVQQLLQAFAPP